jgi:hypothetical protein
MDQTPPTLNQLNIVSGNLVHRLLPPLGRQHSRSRVWRTSTSVHHASAEQARATPGIDLDLDSAAFAQLWNTGWRGREDIAGRVVLGLSVTSRQESTGFMAR